MDREKVIKAWECCNPFNQKCKECPYEKDCYHDGISRHMVADAIAMLKEQEAKSVEIDGQMFSIKYGHCPKCGEVLINDIYPHWCGVCGQAVKWE